MAQLLEEISGDLGRIHQVGQNAMDEIYISWDQATRLAYDRYKEIREMVKEGELGVRKHQSFEYLMNSAATILNGTQRVFVDMPREIRADVRESYFDLRDEVKESYNDFKDGMVENYQEFRDKVKDLFSEDYSDDKYDDN